MWRLLLLSFLMTCSLAAPAQELDRAILLQVQGSISPATSDYVVRGLEHAAEQGAALAILRLDTPGGLDSAMREIIQAILGAPAPVVTFVAPSGARAASAGTYILYASHVAAMAPGTNLGAATPVELGGSTPLPQRPVSPGTPEQARQGETDALGAKRVNDAVAFIRSLAQLRGRNADWAEQAVREAASLPAQDALALGVIDLVAADTQELLAKLHGRTVQVLGRSRVLDTEDIVVVPREPDWRNRLLAVITDPNVAYLLLILGVYGLIFEFISPGFILPGVVGAIALLLGLYALHILPINYAGLGLMLLGLAFMVAEAFAPSFGVLGIGGAIAFIVGSLLLKAIAQHDYPNIQGILYVSTLLVLIVGFIADVAQRLVDPRLRHRTHPS